MSIEGYEARRKKIRQGIWRTIWTILAIDALLVLRMLGVL
jgi:hypothetical protein